MFCEFCGKPVSDYAKYCRHCGAKLDYYRNIEAQNESKQPTPEIVEQHNNE